MINIEDHKVWVESHKMYMIPYSVAAEAIGEKVLSEIKKNLEELSKALETSNKLK